MGGTFTFTPKTEEEIQKAQLLEDGDYTFELIQAKFKTSQAGNPMIELVLKVFDNDGSQRIIYDYLLSNHKNMEYKIRHFCYSVGLEKEYESGELSELNFMKALSGKARIKTRKDKDGTYPPKNVVQDYLGEKIESANEIKDDDVPF